MQILTQPHPRQILQIYRDRLKPGSHAAYGEIERDIARACAELEFPHPYLAIEPLTGPGEVWFLNRWESEAEQKRVADDYAKNAPLVEAIGEKGQAEGQLHFGACGSVRKV